jgi:SRSO17 transposase
MAWKPSANDVTKWRDELESVSGRIGLRFVRPEVRQRAQVYLELLLANVPRKNGWQLAEHAGDATPKNIQHFLGRARWDADEVRDDLQQYVVKHLAQKNGVLIIDETGFLKKGTKSAGVGRQYSGTAGRIENCQIGVFLAYRSSRGHALIDRELYLPKVWCDDRGRCDEARIPETKEFATKPALARQMLKRAVQAGVPARWVAADEVYGSDSKFRNLLQNQGLNYVVTISCQQRLFLNDTSARVDQHVQAMRHSAWKKLSCGRGTKGDRYYEWAFVPFGTLTDDGKRKGLLVRRSVKDKTDIAYYFTLAPARTRLQTLVNVAGSRWAIEECFEQSKQETGLDEYEVRSWHAWYRHITLSMFAHAMLSVLRFHANSNDTKKGVA